MKYWRKPEAHREIADKVTDNIRDIIDFQAIHVAEVIRAMDDIAAAAGARMTERGGTNMAGVNNQPFASKVFNLIDQLLFSIKALDIADAAIDELKANRKPVIGFKSTMGSFLDHIGAQPGERLEKIDFSLTLKRALEGVMRYTEKDAQGNSIPGTISLADLTEDGRAEYQRILDKIIKASSGITISPIDVMIKRIQDAGYTVKEITGRKIMLDIQDDGSAIVTTRFETDKKKIVREFNEGELDVVMLNMSEATGISMHASSKFKDQRQRVMIDGQLELDINKAVQKRGRIDRVGQVVQGAYRLHCFCYSGRIKLLMMFKKNLNPFDANTTSSQKSIKTADVC
ncbi:MAG: strawberry notch C-terminal domain-containing protein [Chitinophagaceae bacterium]|nr:strawberry notch C-terminal domain-containing protein [Chitinophagaceae bacterium]